MSDKVEGLDRVHKNTKRIKRTRDYPIIYLKESKHYRQVKVYRVKDTNPKKVKLVANKLFATYYLLSVQSF